MASTKSVINLVATVALVAGFGGLGVLGLALIGMAVTLSGSAPMRLAVLVLGVGGCLVALGYGHLLRVNARGSAPG